MNPLIQKILYATDLSENSRNALNYAVSLAQKYAAQIYILNVLESLSNLTQLEISGYLGSEEWERLQKDNEKQLLNDIKTRLREFCADAASGSPLCNVEDDNILVQKGVPVIKILEAADTTRADIIIMGTHGYGMVKDALMGGTVRRVLRRSPLPVLVVPSPKGHTST